MKDLIEALTIFMKYGKADAYAPTHCEHDVLMIAGLGIESAEDVSAEDRVSLDKLGFHWSDEYDCFVSYRFGSC